MIWIAQFRLGPRGGLGFYQAVRNADHARLAIEFEKHFYLAVFIGFPNGLKAYFKYFTWIDFSCDFFPWLHAVKKRLCGQRAHWSVGAVAPHVVQKHLWIHQIAVQILTIDNLAFKLFFKLGFGLRKVNSCLLYTSPSPRDA